MGAGDKSFRLGRVLCLLVLVLAGAAPALSQNAAPPSGTTPQGQINRLPPGVTPQQALELLQARPAAQGNTAPGQQPSSQQQVFVSSTPAILATRSRLEELYSRRAGQALTQFGYDLIGNGGTPWVIDAQGESRSIANGGGTVSNPQIGAVQDDYVLGPGDSLTITYRGRQNDSYGITVARDGTVTLPNIAPIAAAGRRFGDFRADLQNVVARSLLQTQVFVSVLQIRQLSVRVAGEVGAPGVYSLNGLSTVLDALNLAGGIKKSGSLRNVTIVRGTRSFRLDLYALLLTQGQTPDLTVAQGDRIVVPAIGATAAAGGDVRRPGIYELPAGAAAISSRDLLDFAQGPQIRGLYRQSILQTRADGKQEFTDIADGQQASLRDGEVLIVRQAIDVALGRVSLQGAVRLPGEFALSDKHTLRDLLPSMDSLAPDPYLLLGIIDRLDPVTLQRVPVVFSPLHVINGSENADLASNDIVRVFSVKGNRALASRIAAGRRQALQNQSVSDSQADAAAPLAAQEASSAARNIPLSAGASTAGTASTAAAMSNAAAQPPADTPPAPADLGGYPLAAMDMLTRRLTPYFVDLGGAVRQAGPYLVAPQTSMAELITIAGGLESDADLSQFEVTSTVIDNQAGHAQLSRQTYPATAQQFAGIKLRGSEEIVFHHVSTEQDGGEVQVAGEVRYPGTYHVLRGEKLSSLIARAGGYLTTAYPFGAVFTRLSVAKAQNDAYAAEADEMEKDLAAYSLSGRAALSGNNAAPQATTVTGLNDTTGNYLEILTARLRKTQALGRLSIHADLDTLKKRPDLDIVLEPGDRLVVPRTPASVNVVGEVRNPSGIVFNGDMTVGDYIRAAGGTTRLADAGGEFIIYPDGTSAPLSRGFWSVGASTLTPGSTIVVPRDVTPPVDWIDLTTKVATIVGQIAITAASIAVISGN